MNEGVAVVGAGGWGTALAVLLSRMGRKVTLVPRREAHARTLREARVNADYLPGVELPQNLEITSDAGVVAASRYVILAVPSQFVRETFRQLLPYFSKEHSVLNAAKGLEIKTGLRLSQVIAEECAGRGPGRLAVLSGPNHAEEVGRGLPTTSVIASADPETAEAWQELLMCPTFRVYTNEDVVGVELGGALKNVIALAAGISDGLGFGDNTKAALLTRGLAEMSRLGQAMGARLLTFSGLSGMGDLIATCTSPLSRNARAGRAIGEGKSVDEVVRSTSMVIEGIPTCRATLGIAAALGVEMPITEAVGAVLFEGKSPRQAVDELMGRGAKDEIACFLGEQ